MSQKKLFAEKITFQAIAIVLLAASFYLYEFIIQVAPAAITKILMIEFAIDATELGLISAAFYYAYTPLQLTTGLLLDRYSSKTILTIVTLICTFGVALFAYAPNLYTAVFARFIIGGAASCAFIGVLHLAIRWIPPIYFAFFTGLVQMMGSIGGMLGSKSFAVLLKHFDWRTTMKGFAAIGLLLAILIAIFVRNRPKNVQKITIHTDSKNFIINNLKKVLHNKESWSIGIYSFLVWAPILGFAALWGVPFLQLSNNIDNITATKMIAYIWIGIAITSPVVGWLSDFIGRRCIIMGICGIVGTIAITIVIFVTNITLVLLSILMFTIGLASAGQTLAFALIKDKNPPSTIGTANGFNNMCVVAGGLIFPILIGTILDLNSSIAQEATHEYNLFNYQIALLTLPICYLISSIISIFCIKETYCLNQDTTI